MKGLTHAREPMLSWSPFRPETYGSEHPGHRCVPCSQLLVLHVPQTVSSNARKVCFIHDCPICSKRASLSRAAAHSIKVLRNNRMIGLRQRKPIGRLVAIVTRVCSYCQTDLCRVVSLVVHVFDVPNDNIRPRHKGWPAGPTACCMGGMTIDFVSPLTSWSIWIGCIAAPTEIVPTTEPASDGRPSAWANSFETTSLPFVMASDCAAAS